MKGQNWLLATHCRIRRVKKNYTNYLTQNLEKVTSIFNDLHRLKNVTRDSTNYSSRIIECLKKSFLKATSDDTKDSYLNLHYLNLLLRIFDLLSLMNKFAKPDHRLRYQYTTIQFQTSRYYQVPSHNDVFYFRLILQHFSNTINE